MRFFLMCVIVALVYGEMQGGLPGYRSTDDDHLQGLHDAITRVELKTFRTLLEACPLEKISEPVEKSGLTLLHAATAMKYAYGSIVLMEDIDSLHYQQLREKYRAMATLLLEKGADIHAIDRGVGTPLHCAAKRDARMCELLIHRGAKIEETNSRGYTPFVEAIIREPHISMPHWRSAPDGSVIPREFGPAHTERCNLLLEYGAQVDLKRPIKTDKPLLIALAYHPDTLDVKQLSQAQLNLLLRYATQRADKEMTHKLLNWGASCIARDTLGVNTLEIIYRLAYVLNLHKQAEYKEIYQMLVHHISMRYRLPQFDDSLPEEITQVIMAQGVACEIVRLTLVMRRQI